MKNNELSSKQTKELSSYRAIELSSQRAKDGFTLLETIIYIAIFSVITSFVMVVFYQLIGGEEIHRNRVEVDTEANFMMQKLVWALSGASQINQPTAGATSSIFSVDKFNYGQNPVTLDIASRNLRISKASAEPAPLNSKRVFIERFVVEHLPAVAGARAGVAITLAVVSSDITRPAASTTLTNTIYLR